MIEVYSWTTPNGYKIPIFLEEAGLDYEIKPVDLSKGEQFQPDFLKIAPNNRIPAIIDLQPAGGGRSLPLFESGAILEYLADKTGRFLGAALSAERYTALQWLYWQVGGFGPMLGQNYHFSAAAPEKIPYAIERYRKETQRLYGVLDAQLAENEFVAGAYSIADMACYPWTVPHGNQGIDLKDYPNIARWFETVRARPAVIRAYERAEESKARG